MTALPLFAQAIADMNASVVGMLGNAVVTLAGVEQLALFNNAYALGKVGEFGMASNAPSLVLLTSSVPADPLGAAVAVTDPQTLIVSNYTVASHEPDGTGISRLWLEAA